MEYFDGSPLDSMMPARVYSELTLLKITKEIILAVQEIHDAQVVHGDIKPDNILLSPQGSVKFVDFELSRMISDELSMDKEELVGSMGYIAPEVILNEMTNTFLSDIFSTGMTLYYLWTGFHGCLANSPESFTERLQIFNPKANLLSNGVHPRLSDLICAMVDPNPHYRPHSLNQATVLIHELHESLRSSLAMTLSSPRWTTHSPRHHPLNSVQ
jgi:serine/threonine-protein kinase